MEANHVGAGRQGAEDLLEGGTRGVAELTARGIEHFHNGLVSDFGSRDARDTFVSLSFHDDALRHGTT